MCRQLSACPLSLFASCRVSRCIRRLLSEVRDAVEKTRSMRLGSLLVVSGPCSSSSADDVAGVDAPLRTQQWQSHQHPELCPSMQGRDSLVHASDQRPEQPATCSAKAAIVMLEYKYEYYAGVLRGQLVLTYQLNSSTQYDAKCAPEVACNLTRTSRPHAGLRTSSSVRVLKPNISIGHMTHVRKRTHVLAAHPRGP